jgi:hypothetical protein
MLDAHSELVAEMVPDSAPGSLDSRELTELRRRITQLVDLDEDAYAHAFDGEVAAVAADVFNAEGADSRLLLAAAECELRANGTVRGELARALRERAELRDARRHELLATHRSLLF